MRRPRSGLWVSFGLLAMVSVPAAAAEAAAETVLRNPTTEVALSSDHKGLVVTDLRTGRQWAQSWLEKNPECRHEPILVAGNSERELTLACSLPGVRDDGRPGAAAARIQLRLHESQPELEATIEFTEPTRWRQAAYPYVFARDGERLANLFPHCEGLLVPVRKTDPDWFALPDGDFYGGVHAYCMCLGIVDEGPET